MYNTHTLHFHMYFLKQLKSECTRELPSSVGNSSLLRDQKEHFTLQYCSLFIIYNKKKSGC